MEVTLKKWGNSPSVRIPAAIMKAAALEVDQKMDIRFEGGVITITPIRAPDEVDLETLLDAITPENTHSEVDFDHGLGLESF